MPASDIEGRKRKPRTPSGGALVLALISTVLSLGFLEAGARFWVTHRWEPDRVMDLTQRSEALAGYVFDSETGYRLEPGRYRRDSKEREFRHDSVGFRGSDFSLTKDSSTYRVVIMGASTVYGIYVSEDETSAAQLLSQLEQRNPNRAIEVINAGVPGWTSRETLLNLRQRVLDLSPDAIVVVDGRNEIFPELFHQYAIDYGHYRPFGGDFREANARYRALFRFSHLTMMIVAAREERFGFSRKLGHPVYGYIRWENVPDDPDMIANAANRDILTGYQANLEAIIELSIANGILPVVSGIPFDANTFSTGVLATDDRPMVLPVLGDLVARNNHLAQEIADKFSIPWVDPSELSSPQYLYDDCHFRPEGEAAFAVLLANTIDPYVKSIGTKPR